MMWSEERLFFDGDAWMESLVAGIRSAQTSVLLETYIFESDVVGARVLDELSRAARRGVRVCLLVDGVGAAVWLRAARVRIRASGVEVRIYHPLPHVFTRFIFGTRRWLWLVLKAIRAINRRTHRKFCLVDGARAWLGSLNISAVHCRSASGAQAWRDTGVFLAGGPAGEIRAAFLDVWRRSWRIDGLPQFARAPRRHPPSGLVLVNTRREQRRRFHAELLGRIGAAREKVWLTTAYFVPSGSLLRALKRAARAGADVRILVPRRSDVPFMPWVSLAFYWSLLASGIRVYEYERTILHAKTAIVDDWCLVGSMNLNNRSMYRDLEIGVSLVAERSRLELETAFWMDLGGSRAVSLPDLDSRPRWQRWVAQFFLIFKWML